MVTQTEPLSSTVSPPDAQSAKTGVRQLTGLSAVRERKLLMWLADRQPAWVTPNLLTGLGVAGGLITCIALALSGQSRVWLIAAILGLWIHWYGDSLDGSLARARSIERPRFGMFFDQCADLGSVALIMLGLALSPFVRADVALGAYAGYLLIAVFVHLRANITGIYDIALDRLGPTEGRVILSVVFVFMMFAEAKPVFNAGGGFTAFDVTFGVIIAWGVLTTAMNMWRLGRKLAAEEPPKRALQTEKRL